MLLRIHFLKFYGPNFFSIKTIGDGLQGEINSSQNGSGASLSMGTKNGNNGNLLSQLTKSTIVSIFVIVLLSFLFCSSLYLVFRIDSLQKQVRRHQCTLIAIQKMYFILERRAISEMKNCILHFDRSNLRGSIF